MIPTWKQKGIVVFFCCCIFLFYASFVQAQDYDEDIFTDELVMNGNQISDPLEPINRAFFVFNDKLYFWVLKPASQTYALFLPEDFRMCIGNAFRNILAPIRVVNNLLQGKVSDSGTEVARFFINTIAGAGGLGDPASDFFDLHPKNEDLGQTLGKWGVGEGIYFCWPILGPSNVRDTIGYVGDAFLNPLTYVAMSSERAGFAAQAGVKVNNTSLTIGDYEAFKEAAFDPYTAMRDFYYQSRQSKISDKMRLGEKISEHRIEPVRQNERISHGVEPVINSENLVREPEVIQSNSLADLNNIEKMFGNSSLPLHKENLEEGISSLDNGIQYIGSIPSVKELLAGLRANNDFSRM